MGRNKSIYISKLEEELGSKKSDIEIGEKSQFDEGITLQEVKFDKKNILELAFKTDPNIKQQVKKFNDNINKSKFKREFNILDDEISSIDDQTLVTRQTRRKIDRELNEIFKNRENDISERVDVLTQIKKCEIDRDKFLNCFDSIQNSIDTQEEINSKERRFKYLLENNSEFKEIWDKRKAIIIPEIRSKMKKIITKDKNEIRDNKERLKKSYGETLVNELLEQYDNYENFIEKNPTSLPDFNGKFDELISGRLKTQVAEQILGEEIDNLESKLVSCEDKLQYNKNKNEIIQKVQVSERIRTSLRFIAPLTIISLIAFILIQFTNSTTFTFWTIVVSSLLAIFGIYWAFTRLESDRLQQEQRKLVSNLAALTPEEQNKKNIVNKIKNFKPFSKEKAEKIVIDEIDDKLKEGRYLTSSEKEVLKKKMKNEELKKQINILESQKKDISFELSNLTQKIQDDDRRIDEYISLKDRIDDKIRELEVIDEKDEVISELEKKEKFYIQRQEDTLNRLKKNKELQNQLSKQNESVDNKLFLLKKEKIKFNEEGLI